MFGEWIDARLPGSKTVKAAKVKEDLNGSLECTLERTLKPIRLTVGSANGIFKLRNVTRRPPSQQWNAVGVTEMASLPWQPKGDAMDPIAFVMPPDLGVNGRVKLFLGLERVDAEDEKNEVLEDMVPEQSESVTAQELLENDGTDRVPSQWSMRLRRLVVKPLGRVPGLTQMLQQVSRRTSK